MNSDDSSSMYSSAETEENERINHHDFQLTHSPSEAWEDHDWSESDTASLGYHALQHQQAISMEASLAAFPRHAEMNIAEDSNSSHPPRHPSAAAASSVRLNIPLPLRFHVPPIPLSPSPSSEASSSSNLSPASSASSSNAPSPASSSGRATSSSSSTSRKRKSTSSSSHSRRHSGSRSSRQAIPAIVSSPPSQAPPTALILQRIPIHSEWRLMNQRKYDQMRRDLLKTLLGKMKTTMASAEKVVQDARRSVEDFSAMSAVPSFSTSSFSGSSSSSSSSGGSPTSDDSRRDSPVESLPMHEVLTQAVQLIRNLTAVKSDLQQTLDGLCDSEEHPGQNAILKQERDRNSMEEDPSILRKGFQKAHYQNESDALSQLDSLVFTLSTLSRHFSSDLNSLQALSASLSPLLLHPSFSLFSEFGITGCSARIACVMRLEENSPFRLPFSCVPKCLDVGLDFAADFRLPLMTQVHAMAMLLSRRFKYRDGSVRKLDAPPELDELHQLIFESRSSTAERLSESTEAEEEERCERELLSHPLGQFSLPQSSYRVLQQVLSFLVSLGKFEYERLASTLRPFFSSSYPRDCPSDNHEPFIQFTNHLPAFTIRQLVFSGVNTPTFEHIQAFYALYCGTEDLVTFRACPMPSPHGKLLYLDHDFLILRHPRNGLPLAFILIPRKCYEGEIEVQNLDELNAWPRIDTVVEKQMEKMRLDEKKIPSQLIGGKREQKEDEHDVQLEGPRKKARSL